MKKWIFALLLLFFVGPAYANLEFSQDGTRVGGVGIRANFTGDVTVTGAYSDKTIDIGTDGGMTVEVVSDTEETVVAGDSPRRFIMTATTEINLVNLPAAADNLIYQIVDGGVSGGTLGQGVVIHPASGDTIKYAPDGEIALAANERLRSNGDTGDSVTLVGASGVWYVVDMGAREWDNVGVGN